MSGSSFIVVGNATLPYVTNITGQTAAPVFNVKSYGAQGDNVTDDTNAINNALAAVSAAGGGQLYFPQGTYITSSAITIPVNTIIQGSGRVSSIISRNTPGDVLLSSHTLNGSTAAYIEVRDMGLTNTSTLSLSNWQAGHPYSTGTLLQVPKSRIVLKCTTGGTSGSFVPIGQLSWIKDYETSLYTGPNVTLSGTPNNTYQITIQIVSGGPFGSATFQWSSNQGTSWTGPLTTGASVSLAGTGLVANFSSTQGNYTTASLCCSPTAGWSLINGTTITDGTVQWQVLDGGACFTDVAGTFVRLENLNIVGGICGIIFDQTEVAEIHNVICSAASGSSGFAGLWVSNGGSHSSGGLYGEVTDLTVNKLWVTNYNIGVVDDGGVTHAYHDIGFFGQGTYWGYFAGTGQLQVSNVYADGVPTGKLDSHEYLYPDLNTISAASGFANVWGTLPCYASFRNIRVTSGGPAALTIAYCSSLVIENTISDATAAAISGANNAVSIVDIGGNICGGGGNFYDTLPAKFVGLTPFSAATGSVAGVGIGALPDNGLTVNGRFELLPKQGNIVGGADNPNLTISDCSTYEITTFFSGSTAFSISGVVSGVNGRIIRIVNMLAVAMTIKHQSSLSAATARIISPTGADLVLSGNIGSSVTMYYSGGTTNRWVVLDYH